MVRPRSGGVQPTEWDILSTLWDLGSATAGEVTKAIQTRRSWAYSTVKTLLKRMVNKGLVRARLRDRVWRFSPVLSREELRRRQWEHFVETAFDGSVIAALEFLLSGARLTPRQRRTLKGIVKAKSRR